MNELHLFAGAGGGILGGQLLGHRTVCAVEIEPYPRSVLVARQNDGTFPPFPIWDDVRTFDGKPWCGIVDVVCGGFPCQDISAAGKGAGLSGQRSGLWSEFARIIGEVRPRCAFIENSPMLVTRGLDRVLSDLAALGYDAEWCCLSAGDCGAWHERDRIWILAANREHKWTRWRDQFAQSKQKKNVEYANLPHEQGIELSQRIVKKYPLLGINPWAEGYAFGIRMDDGMDYWAHRVKAVGNGQVPIVAATAFKLLKTRLDAYPNLHKLVNPK